MGKDPDWAEVRDWLKFLENESAQRKKYLKAYLVYGNDDSHSKEQRTHQLAELGTELNLQHVALTFVPSFTDSESDINRNKINPNAGNTFLIYGRSRVIANFVNLKPSAENFEKIQLSMDKTINEYFDLPAIKKRK